MIKPKRKPIEPFNLFGENALISSKEEAVTILRDNSYYFIVVGFIHIGFVIFIILSNIDTNYSIIDLSLLGLFNIIAGISIRKFKSRIASFLILASFAYDFTFRALTGGAGAITIFTTLFLAASYRSVRASLIYHKLNKTVIQGKKVFQMVMLLLVLIVMGRAGYDYGMKEFGALAASIYKDDFASGKITDEKDCLDCVPNSLNKNDDFISQYAVLVAFNVCLDKINPTEKYCLTIPDINDHDKSLTWQRNLCEQFNISIKACSDFSNQLQRHCEKR